MFIAFCLGSVPLCRPRSVRFDRPGVRLVFSGSHSVLLYALLIDLSRRELSLPRVNLAKHTSRRGDITGHHGWFCTYGYISHHCLELPIV
ncbi:hypothetical protein BV22DRAFT_757462 [Leucogyrophana mollusca]|uniref:Uncharacterized protein n=1 Tax=Leucogyrophana mollusca TaxID=85980 RepID=A0ACB8B714_9AGAM|nr:hypothetical protein BV22DRAFT_757462 [Leucogyrophana mollusca]